MKLDVNPDFDKMQGLVPAVVQDADTREVLMVGFMNRDAYEETQRDGKVTFWSRSKQRLWQKGESTRHFLNLVEMRLDCDRDTILVLARPSGPTCHTGDRTCFGEPTRGIGFLAALEIIIESRDVERPSDSYTTTLFEGGLPAITAKVEEESEEVVRAAREETLERLAEESGDLLYHLLVLLRAKKVSLDKVMMILETRHQK